MESRIRIYHHLKKNGFSFLEIMISLSIGLVLVGTLLIVFVQTRASYNAVTALANIQEDGRFAYVFLAKVVRQAKSVRVYSQDSLPANFQKQVIAGSDILLVQHQQDKKVYFIADTHRSNERGQSVYALYEKKWLPGVETMRRELLPGVDSLLIYLEGRNLMIDLCLNSIEPLSAGLLPFIYTHDNISFFDAELRLHRKWPVHLVLNNSKQINVAVN